MMDLKKLFEEFQKEWKTFKDVNEKAISTGSAETAVHKETIEKINGRLCDLEKAINDAKVPPMVNADPVFAGADENHTKAILDFIKHGDRATKESYDVLKAFNKEKVMTVGDDTTGGFLAPVEMLNMMIRDIVEISRFRQLAEVRNTSRRQVQIPVNSENTDAQWVAEEANQPERTNPTFSMLEVTAHKLYGRVDVTDEDLEDTELNLIAFLTGQFTEQFAKSEGKAFINGDGVGKPFGILAPNSKRQEIVSGSAALITPDGIIRMLYNGLKSAYWSNTSWVMNRKTIGSVRLFKDTTDRYLFDQGFNAQPSGLAQTTPGTLLGRPIVEMPDMPDESANAFPVALGDWKQAYIIIDRLATSILRDQYTLAGQGVHRIFARKRLGGQVKKFEAYVINKCSV